MKKIFVLALSALLVAAFSGVAMAKVNLSGAIWVTYWAQQQGQTNLDVANGTGSWNSSVNAAGTLGLTPANGVASAYGRISQPGKKTFLLAQTMSGNGVTAKNNQGYGLELVADCPVNDWVKAYGDFNTNGAALTLVEGYINLAFMKEFNVRVGRMQVPFGHERTVRPTAGVEEVFISEYTQSLNAALLRHYDVGAQAYGTLASGMVDYNFFLGNGTVPTVADNAAADVFNSQATPDIDDAK